MRFADTSFWFALQVPRERNHHDAAALARQARPVLTSNHVLSETWTLLNRRAGHSAAVGFLDRFERLEDVQVEHIDQTTEHEAWRWLRRHDEREFSFVDATSFALMRARRLREALAFDGDFSAAGFLELRL